MKKKLVAAGAAATLLVAGGAGAWAAFGSELTDAETTERGTCAGAVWQLSVEDDDGLLELEAELQSRAPGETWGVVVRQGGAVVLDGERTTDEDAEIDVDVPIDEDGARALVVTATPDGGAPCVASLTR